MRRFCFWRRFWRVQLGPWLMISHAPPSTNDPLDQRCRYILGVFSRRWVWYHRLT